MDSIDSQRVFLRQLKFSDAMAVYEYASSDAVTEYCAWDTHRSLIDAENFLENSFEKHCTEFSRLNLAWGIEAKSSVLKEANYQEGKIYGCIELSKDVGSELRIDYVIAEGMWNKGLMTEAANAVIQWAFANYPEATGIRSSALSENVASTRVMEKSGMDFQEEYFLPIEKFQGQMKSLKDYRILRP